jgi:hypothetical protein
MKIQVMLMLLGVLVVVIASSYFLKKKNEHFADAPPDTSRLSEYKKLDKDLTNANARRYNYVSDGMNDFLGGFFNPQNNNEPVITKQIQDAVNNVQVVGSTKTESGNYLQPMPNANTHMPHSYVLDIIKACEAQKINVVNMSDNQIASTCAKLDDPANAECGFCLKNGTDSKGKMQVGGLYFSSYDRTNGNTLQANVNDSQRQFSPTVGLCETKNFVTSRARCVRRINEILCESSGGLPQRSPDVANGCGQCANQGLLFLYNGDKTRTFDAVLHLIVDGPIYITMSPRNSATASQTVSDMNKGLRYTKFIFSGVTENDNFSINNQGNVNNILAGQWANTTGSRSLPFYESLTDKNSVFIGGNTNSAIIQQTIAAKDLANFHVGTLTVKSTRVGASEANFPAGTGNGGKFSINASIPGYLGEPLYDEDAAICPTGGILGTTSSMILNKSNPCYSEDANAPLTQTCLSNLFSAAGGNSFGKAYPINTTKATALLTDSGTKTDLNKVMAFLNAKYAIATTGADANGNTLNLDTVNAASMYMLGINITNPCDINTNDGPLSIPCLQLLYDNNGDKYGRTYTNSFGAYTSFCNNKGSASPTNAAGKTNPAAVKNALAAIPTPPAGQSNSSTAVQYVQQYFSKIHAQANTSANATNADIVMGALASCYGINVPNQAPAQTACDQNQLALYDVSQQNTNNSDAMRVVFPNIQNMGPMADVNLVMVKNNGSQVAVNDNTIKITAYSEPGVWTTISCRNAISINFWVKVNNPPTYTAYNFFLADFRPALQDVYLWSAGEGTYGSFWKVNGNGADTGNQIFIDGDVKKTWKGIMDNKWHLVTINLAKPYTGLLNMFGANNGWGVMNCEFGPIGIYQNTRTQAEITADFNARPSWAQTPNFLGYFYQGCFGDSWNRALPNYSGQVGSVAQCAQIAKNMNMNCFGVQYYGQCWTGNYPNNDYAVYGAINACPPLGGGWNNQVYFNSTMQITGIPCKVLGQFGIGPWGASSRFADNAAQWIWDDQNAASNAVAGKWISFSTQVNTDVECYAIFHLIADDQGEVYLNNKSIGTIGGGGWGTTNYTRMKLQLPTGQNNIRIKAMNGGGPAGLVASLIRSDGVVLARTDRTWTVSY